MRRRMEGLFINRHALSVAIEGLTTLLPGERKGTNAFSLTVGIVRRSCDGGTRRGYVLILRVICQSRCNSTLHPNNGNVRFDLW